MKNSRGRWPSHPGAAIECQQRRSLGFGAARDRVRAGTRVRPGRARTWRRARPAAIDALRRARRIACGGNATSSHAFGSDVVAASYDAAVDRRLVLARGADRGQRARLRACAAASATLRRNSRQRVGRQRLGSGWIRPTRSRSAFGPDQLGTYSTVSDSDPHDLARAVAGIGAASATCSSEAARRPRTSTR